MGFLINSVFIIILSITFFNLFLLLLLVVEAKDALNPGDELKSEDPTSYFSSANGDFILGFFTIPSTNFTYLGIWYSTFDQVKKVWVANRDIPMIGDGVLMIDASGTLKVVDRSGTTLFNVSNRVDTTTTTGNNKTRAVLQDSGNFLVYDSTDNRTLWQSFDHPTDTLVPGMKLGYNLTTKQNWTLNSWLTNQVPASGAFTMRLEQYQNSPQLIIYWRGEVYWVSGPWNKNSGSFQLLGSLISFPSPFQLNLSLISDASGMYFTFRKIESSSSLSLFLSPKGHFISGANKFNATPIFCYGYQSNDGCAVSAILLPKCRGQRDSFHSISGRWDDSSVNYDVNSSISFSDCMERCWKNCSCVGFNTVNDDGTGCVTYTSNTLFRVDESGQATQKYVLVSQKPPKKKTWIWILVSVAIVLTFVLAAFLCYMRIRRHRLEEEEKKRNDFTNQLTGSNSFHYGDEFEMSIEGAPEVKIFSLKAILAATDNFSNVNKLGEGGYGPVYKGILFDGREIAVKRLSKTSGQGVEQFKSELILISKLQHTNLVRLYGCCIHQEEKMLIYELMPNKSLDCFLFAEDKKGEIDWRMRFNIIEGVAQGLLYLHKYSRMKVIHRDLKVSNVLLDENMNPKIADFGMARIFQQNMIEGTTERVVGTYGYMAPEYAMEGSFSFKTDVFSFGVLVLEIVSGKKNSSIYNLDRSLNLVGYAWELWKEDATLELKDETLGESCDVKQLLRAIHVALLCVQDNAHDRPTMSDVISMLNNDIADLPNPVQPAFYTGKQQVAVSSSETKSTEHLLDPNTSISQNSLTLTIMEAR